MATAAPQKSLVLDGKTEKIGSQYHISKQVLDDFLKL